MFTSGKLFSRAACLLLAAILTLTLLPFSAGAAEQTALSGADEAWMWPLGSSAGLRQFTSHLGKRSAHVLGFLCHFNSFRGNGGCG